MFILNDHPILKSVVYYNIYLSFVNKNYLPLYEKYADITIDEEGKDLDESLRAILEIIHIKEQGK